jgi:cytochrome b561
LRLSSKRIASDSEGELRYRRPAADSATYDSITIFLHWLTVIVVLILFVFGIWPGVLRGSTIWHKWLGLSLLIIIPLRIIWRLALGRRSTATAGEPLLLRLGAKGAHIALYVLVIATSVLGWYYVDARADTLDFFGIDMPMLVYYDRPLQYQLYFWKQIAAYGQ